MSSPFSSLFHTAMPRFSRTLLAASRPLPPPLRTPQWESFRLSARLSARPDPPHQFPDGQGRPLPTQSTSSLKTCILYKLDGTPRDKLMGLSIAGVALFSLALLYETHNSEAKKNKLLKRAVHVQRAVSKLPTIDANDPLALFNVLRDISAAFKGKEYDLETSSADIEAYIKKHEVEMKEYTFVYCPEHMHKLLGSEKPLEALSTPEFVKVLLAYLCFSTSELMQGGDLVGTLSVVGETVVVIVGFLKNIAAEDKDFPKKASSDTDDKAQNVVG